MILHYIAVLSDLCCVCHTWYCIYLRAVRRRPVRSPHWVLAARKFIPNLTILNGYLVKGNESYCYSPSIVISVRAF